MLHIEQDTFDFIQSLKMYNSKEWMDENRDWYQNARSNYVDVVTAVLEGLQLFDNSLEGVDPKKSIYRINRDIRFSPDKTPYKQHFGASFVKNGKNSGNAGYYFHIEPGNCFMGAGVWHPDNQVLKALRQEIDYNLSEWLSIVENPKFVKNFGQLQGEQLQQVPRGYEKTHPAAQYLKYKSFLAHVPLTDAFVMQEDMVPKLIESLKLMVPLVQFINRSLD